MDANPACRRYAQSMNDTGVLELYAGIGGVAAAGAAVVAAIDHDERAHLTYRANFAHPAHRLNLVSVKKERLAGFGAPIWWMSPPCQPFTVRGAKRDVNDRRCESLLHLLEVIPQVQPRVVLVENVPGFDGSIAQARLKEALAGYAITDGIWCPTELGVPMQRRRYYLVAVQGSEPVELVPEPVQTGPLASFLDPEPDPAMRLGPELLERFGEALHVVEASDPHAEAVCFTGAYGHSPVYAGSYLRREGGLYRFSPAEIARLMGFPEGFVLPDDVRHASKLLGNSVSVDVVRWLLGAVLRRRRHR